MCRLHIDWDFEAPHGFVRHKGQERGMLMSTGHLRAGLIFEDASFVSPASRAYVNQWFLSPRLTAFGVLSGRLSGACATRDTCPRPP